MKKSKSIITTVALSLAVWLIFAGCFDTQTKAVNVKTGPNSYSNCVLDNGDLLLGNNKYPAMSYSGYRTNFRSDDNCPTVADLKEDMKILSALGIKLIRTYNTADFPQSKRLLQAISELKKSDPDFEMYVMIGAWIKCKGAYTESPDHNLEDAEWNLGEIDRAVEYAVQYPDIVKVIAVGNEAMVRWQAHFVPARVILKWVNYLRAARMTGKMPAKTLITTSDNWATFGGLEEYHSADLVELLKAIDFISIHVYAFHDSVYDSNFQWGIQPYEVNLTVEQQAAGSIERAIKHQKGQIRLVKKYLADNDIKKDIYIGETGWATLDDGHYGNEGACTADEMKSKMFYDAVKKWTTEESLTCFYFEAFDEPWKSPGENGSEDHFGLFTVDGRAKYAMWDMVDKGAFEGLTRGGKPITKTYNGSKAELLKDVKAPFKMK